MWWVLQLKGAQWASKGAEKALEGAGMILKAAGRVSKAVRQASKADGGPQAAGGIFCRAKNESG